MSSVSRSMSAIPPEELPILESLINIRNRLTALKKNSSEFIRAQDVQTLYQAVIKQVAKLNTIRDEREASEAPPRPQGGASASVVTQSSSTTASASPRPPSSNSAAVDNTIQSSGPSSSALSGTATPTHSTSSVPPRAEVDASTIQTNRVDTTLQDVFSLLSLFFLTIGKSRETPATFSQLASMKQLLDHMAESGVYTETDLQPFEKRLNELRDIIKRDTSEGKHPVQLTKLMMRKLDGCAKVLQQLQGTLSILSVELVPIHQRLVSIRRQIVAAAARPKPARQEIRKLQEELRAIDGKRVDGKFLGPGGSSVPAGQAILVGLLEECFEICHDVVVRNDEVPMTLQPIYDRLSEIKGQLEHLVLTHRWTLRETDLWNFQVTLKEIDRLRVDGKFVDSEGKQPEGQMVLLYLLRRCYGLIYRLVASSEPISEELMPISNKLSTVSKCLKEVSKYGGPFTLRDLYPYRLALHQIENIKAPVLDKDGNDTGVKKWLGRDGSVPEGQAILRAQFEEVEQTINEMLNQEEETDEEDVGSDVEAGWAAESDISDDVSDVDEDEEDDQASDSVGFSGVHSRDISMPASPSEGVTSPGAQGLSSALSSAGYGYASSAGVEEPISCSATTPSQLQGTVPPSSDLSSPPHVSSTASGAVMAPGMSSDPLPPGAATLAVPKPGQASLTAAAVSLDSMQNASPDGSQSVASAITKSSPPFSSTLPVRDETSASSTRASATSSSGDSRSTPGGALQPASGSFPQKIPYPQNLSSGMPSRSRGEASFGQSPGADEGDLAKQLQAKLAMEEGS